MQNIYRIICFLMIDLILVGCASHLEKTSDAARVCSYLEEDLEYVQQSVQSNLSVYRFDPDLKGRVDRAYAAGKEQAKSCSSEVDYIRIIRSYFASFHDPHLQPWWQIRDGLKSMVKASLGHDIRPLRVDIKYLSTGIILKKIGAGYYVRSIDGAIYTNGSIAIGDELISCDQKSATDILGQEIIPFEQVSSYEAGLYRHAGKIFFRWDKAPGATSTCEFSRGGSVIKTSLKWTLVEASYLSKFPEPTGPIYSIEKTAYGHWVKLRSLAGYSDAETSLLKSFVTDSKKLRNDQVVVLDLRGNSGGKSSWGKDWIQGLYGFLPKESGKPDLIFSSPGNLGHYERMFELLEKTGGFSTPEDKTDFQKVIGIMRSHPNQLTPLGKEDKSTADMKKPHTLFKGEVYVVSDAGIFSSGELFLQSLRLMPRVTQIGVASDASTQAGDIRFDQTPNGLVFSLGTKVFQSIFVGRKPGEPLTPQIQVTPDAVIEFQGRDSMREQIDKIIFNKRLGN